MKPKGSASKRDVEATVGRVESDVIQPLAMPHYDPVNYILDKIDYEFYNTERVSNRCKAKKGMT